jgi:hypothetical protein
MVTLSEKPAKALVASCKRQQGDVASLLDSAREAPLVRSADASQTTRHDLATLGHEALQQANVAVGNGVDFLGTELADLLAAEKLAATAGTAGRTWTTSRTWAALEAATGWSGCS